MSNNEEFELYDLRIEVIAGKKPMVCGHKIGDSFLAIGENLVFESTKQFSMYSLASLLPILPTKQRLTNPNDWISTDAIIACTDPNCGGQFKITRLKTRKFKHSEVTVVPLKKGKYERII